MKHYPERYNKEIYEHISQGKEITYWLSKTNPNLSILFDWVRDGTEDIYKLYYNQFYSKEGFDFSPIFQSSESIYFISKGIKLRSSFKTTFFGYAEIIAPETGVVEIIVPHGCLLNQRIHLPSNSFILTLDYKEESISRYFEKQKKIKEEEEERLAKYEKEVIAKKLKERERKRILEKEVLQELIDKGEIMPGARREPIPKEIIDVVYSRDKGVCVYCSSKKNLQIDHIIPFSKGGAMSIENLQLLCQKCNLEKSNKIG